MAKLRVIPSDDQRVDRDCVRLMAEMYRKALKGEFQAVAIGTLTEGPHGHFGTAWSQPEDQARLAGAISYLNHRFMQSIHDA